MQVSAPTLLGHEVIDADHLAFADLVTTLVAATPVDFPTLFQSLIEHTEQHFERENALMESSSFPMGREHQGEHLRVLGELKQFKARVDRGFHDFGRAYVVERMLPWFTLHIATMDSALVVHLAKG